MTKRYVPEDYLENMRLQIALARQGTRTPLEFFAELEELIHKSGVPTTPASLRTMFLRGLDVDIREPLILLPIRDINALAHMTMEIYNQFQTKKKAAWARS